MLAWRRFVYLDVHKTASTRIAELLRAVIDETPHTDEDHARPRTRALFTTYAISVRDPWDWYVSLWAYGVAGHGALRRRLDGIAAFENTYCDGAPETFRRWLRALLSEAGGARLPEGFGESSAAGCLGFYTFRHLALSWPRFARKAGTLARLDHAGLAARHRRERLYGPVIRTQHLAEDLTAALERAGRRLRLKPDWRETIARGAAVRRNASPSRPADPAALYDGDTIALVGARDRLLIEEFGWSPPA